MQKTKLVSLLGHIGKLPEYKDIPGIVQKIESFTLKFYYYLLVAEEESGYPSLIQHIILLQG